MSPQQVRELPLDHQTDIYSLGVVMYQLLTGQLPFQASNNYNIIYQIINTEPTPPSALRKKSRRALDAIVARAMAKDTKAALRDLGRVRARSGAGLPPEAAEHAAARFFRVGEVRHLRELPFFADFTDVEIWEVLRFLALEHHPARSRRHARRRSPVISSASSPKANSRSSRTAASSTC
jgi:serine/threonine protein kinase